MTKFPRILPCPRTIGVLVFPNFQLLDAAGRVWSQVLEGYLLHVDSAVEHQPAHALVEQLADDERGADHQGEEKHRPEGQRPSDLLVGQDGDSLPDGGEVRRRGPVVGEQGVLLRLRALLCRRREGLGDGVGHAGLAVK